MTKDANGAWTATVGPLVPEIYEYWFLVHGVKVLDGENKWMKPGDFSASLLEITGNPPRFDQIQEVPHGTLELLTYRSTPFNKRRDLYVYLPPQYQTEPTANFPVLYLRHGNGDTELSWPSQGRAGVILENLIARREAEPMLIVMPYGESAASGGGSRQGIAALQRELVEDISPLLETRYRVLRDRDYRAIAGLSMGGGQAFTMGFSALDQFAWIGMFSSGNLASVDFNLHGYLSEIGVDVDNAKRQLRLMFVSCGTGDVRYTGTLDFVENARNLGLQPVWYSTSGAHEMKVWRHSLREFLPRLFKRPSG
jgi:enterochelin esterase-like enzyme